MRKRFVPTKFKFNHEAWSEFGYPDPTELINMLVNKGFSLLRATKTVYGAGSIPDFLFLVELINGDPCKFFVKK